MAQLPDPTVDLDWSGYDGSISDHFFENAKKYPDRICVIETESSESPERSFTYKQIYEASNVLAHYLHDAGVKNDDVVMIWAHRSVDLVVSIMGVLASGATFSVLDPAYPPARQTVYLEVAQPRALINMARATAEAGPLATSVRKFIDEELELKAEVPSLRLHDDGSLSGAKNGQDDVFAQARTKVSVPLFVSVGPDSIPTLSFTSGSEGKPKGVRGRHFSLVKYFSWMAERFDLSSESRYTMLSGIAHDPIQRDIFTPLFLGARLLVPSKEDIQHEKLAEWMNKHKPTVTHLTPAMGQILVGGASAEFPSLDRAFFVGDILTTRDCKSLQKLAVNCKIVNMYGTTETQRAVSYFEIPSKTDDPEFVNTHLKNTVPAGKGMKNVQLLVVNREDRTKLCGVGETGEIYVRAAGLAEGYKADQALNDSKFYMSWFVENKKWVEADKSISKNEEWRNHYKGPRDRLYRTGDLGVYLESGDVECTGRADDQVKIRGFRVELNEIDSHLSQNELIRDCKTLVRRDRNEETKLVSYIVPETKEWAQWLKRKGLEDIDDEGTDFGPTKVYSKRFRPMQKEVREHLKSRLPTYAIPSVYVVLAKLPLNPNGKVDKANLPFPDIAEQTEEASEEDLERWESMTETQKMIANKWADLIPGLNPKTITLESEFFELGGHSILAQQNSMIMRKETGANISINMLYEHPSLGGYSNQVERTLNPANEVNDDAAKDKTPTYADSLNELLEQLPSTYQTADPEHIVVSGEATVFLTGATGYLGAYIIKDVLERTSRTVKLIAHIRGVKDSNAASDRLKKSLQGYALWKDEWSSRLSCVVGDLSKPKLGLEQGVWDKLAQTVDVVIHNGAEVHWVRTYHTMMASNVISTMDAMKLCNEGKPKSLTYVSSTSVLDNDHYVQLSDQQISTGRQALSEEDDLKGSRTGLGTGYGQTKWVSEQLCRAAGTKGLRGTIIRAGYILGDSETGVCNKDDFLISMLKGCIQLSSRPRIVNTVNSVPVNHVARIVVAAALNPLPTGVHVAHITGHPRLRMNEYLSYLELYGYHTPEVDYEIWKSSLENFVSSGGKDKDDSQFALMGLYHFCISDLPATTRAPELDDRNTVAILKKDAQVWTGVDESAGYGVGKVEVGRILAFLVATGFLKKPEEGRGRAFPGGQLSAEEMGALGAVGGRGGTK